MIRIAPFNPNKPFNMLFDNVYGQNQIKQMLTHNADLGRIPHAYLFVGPEGSGTLPMAIAYARYVLCANTNGENQAGNASCNLKCEHFSHPDMHFSFPVSTNDEVKTHPVSSNFLELWRRFLSEKPYGNEYDWYKYIGIEKKQGIINVDEAHEIINKLYLKPYESNYKVMIVWMCEKMNNASANKLLKIIEEPPKNTIFILITEHEEQIIDTICSRCQIIHFNALPQSVVADALVKKGIDDTQAKHIAHRAHGNINKAFDLIGEVEAEAVFEEWFVFWVRAAFKVRGNKSSIIEILEWSKNIAKTGRETQKRFIDYCVEVFRQALMKNYGIEPLAYIEFQDKSFRFENFVPFVNSSNGIEIVRELEKAAYHIERNGNAEMIFVDLSIALTKLLHRRETEPGQN